MFLFVPYASPDFPEERGNCFGLGFTALPAQQWSRDVVARDGGEEEAPRWPTTNHPTFVRLAEGAATECAWGKRQRQGLITADFFFGSIDRLVTRATPVTLAAGA